MIDNYNDLMLQTVKRTRDTGLEHGFNVCKIDGGTELAGPVCKGNDCEVSIQRCPWPTSYLEFHTHPPGAGLIPSTADIQSVLAEQSEYTCIGTVKSSKSKKGIIQCYKIDHDQVDELRSFIDSAWILKTSDHVTEEQRNEAYANVQRIITNILVGKSKLMLKDQRLEELL